MESMPFYLVLVQSFPDSLILLYLGLGLMGIKLDWSRVLLISLIIALISYAIHLSPLPPGISILIQLFLLVVLLSMLGRIAFTSASLIGVLGLIVLSFFEIVFIALITAITGISITQVMNDPCCVVSPLPEFVILGLIAFWLINIGSSNKVESEALPTNSIYYLEERNHLSALIERRLIAFGFIMRIMFWKSNHHPPHL